MRRLTALCLLMACLAAAGSSFAQVGINKVTYDRFRWSMYASPHFDVYYYPEEEAFLEQVVSFAESAYLKLSEDLDHQLSERTPLVYYKTHPEFQQTNITLSLIPDAVGAFAEPFQNRMVLPIDHPPDQTYKLILHELTHIFQYDILFQSDLGRAVRANPPLWFMEGMASFLAEDETTFDQMIIRDAVINGTLPLVQQLNVLSFLTYRYGNAIFTYMRERAGMEGVRNFIFEFRKVLLTNNLEKAIKEAFGLDLDDFNREFHKYLRQRYLPTLLEKEEPAAYGREIGFERPGVFTFAPSVSPGGELIAVLANRKPELDLWVLSGSDGTRIRNLTKGFTNKYDYLVAEVFDGKRDIAWSPVDDTLAVFARKENRRVLLIFNARTGKKLRTIKTPDIALQASPSFSDDGTKVAFSGNQGGVFDIFSYDLETGEIINHTDDPFVDSNPSWSNDGDVIVYNRRINEYEKVFTVASGDATRKTQLTFGESSDLMPSYSRDGNTLYYSSDRKDKIFNIFTLDLRTADERQLTDVSTGAFSPVEMATLGEKTVVVFSSYFRGRYRLYRMEVGPPVQEFAAADRDLEPVELQPFRAPLRLTLDEDAKKPYKRRYQVESPSLEIGVTDDGTFIGNSTLVLSDLLGDKRWLFGVSSVSSFSRLDVAYLDLARRVNLLYHAYQYEDFFFVPISQTSTTLFVQRVDQRVTGAEFVMQVPFNSKYAWEGSVGASDWKVPVVQSTVDNATGANGFALVSVDFQGADVSSFWVGDTTRYQRYGPFHGQRFRIGSTWSPELSGGGSILEHQIDYRKYIKMSRRSSLAYRLFGVRSDSSNTLLERSYSVGGLNMLRGFGFRDFVGDRAFFQNIELRFPLVDQLRLPFGSFTDIRGVLFVDIGGAYYDGGEFFDPLTRTFTFKCARPTGQGCAQTGFVDVNNNPAEPWDFWDDKLDQLKNGVASFGLGFNFRLGFLELNWVFSRRTNLRTVDPKWRSAFYIGRKF